jgi:hypothetical protein
MQHPKKSIWRTWVVQSGPLTDLPVAILADSLGEPAVEEDASLICDQSLDASDAERPW